jgi:hypothetical protein
MLLSNGAGSLKLWDKAGFLFMLTEPEHDRLSLLTLTGTMF